jgi:integrase
MARVWVYDRTNTQKHRDAVAKAKAAGRKPPARWEVMYYDRRGKLKSEVAVNKTRAADRRTELEASLSAGTYIDPDSAKANFADIAEKWLASRHDLKPSTWWKYRALLDNHVLPKWGELALNVVNHEDIAVWVAKLLKSKEDKGSGLGPSQTRHAFRVLSMVLDWCVPSRLTVNPARGVKLPIRPEAEHVYLSYAQVETLANAAGSLLTKYNRPTAGAAMNKALILLLAYTGLPLG